jgi:hypothetical protein
MWRRRQSVTAAIRLTMISRIVVRLGNLDQPFYEFERRKELDGGAVGHEVSLHHQRMLSATGREGDDAIVIFGVAG